MKLLNARIDDDLMIKLEQLSSLEKVTKSELVRKSLIAYIEKSAVEYEKIPREIVVRLNFLNQIANYGDCNLDNWKLIREEVNELCSMVKPQ